MDGKIALRGFKHGFEFGEVSRLDIGEIGDDAEPYAPVDNVINLGNTAQWTALSTPRELDQNCAGKRHKGQERKGHDQNIKRCCDG